MPSLRCSPSVAPPSLLAPRHERTDQPDQADRDDNRDRVARQRMERGRATSQYLEYECDRGYDRDDEENWPETPRRRSVHERDVLRRSELLNVRMHLLRQA